MVGEFSPQRVMATDSRISLTASSEGHISFNRSIGAYEPIGIGRGVLDRRFELIDKLD
jgi:hypothetical protein